MRLLHTLTLVAALAAPLLGCAGDTSDASGGAALPDAAADTQGLDGGAIDGQVADARADATADAPTADDALTDATPVQDVTADAQAGPDIQPDAQGDAQGDVQGDAQAGSDAEADVPDGAPSDAAAPGPDAQPGGVIEATTGARCSPETRIGLVVIQSFDGGPLDASAAIDDRPPILGAEATASDAACTFYQALLPGFCGACPPGTLCDPASTCQAPPAPLPVTLRLDAGGQSQTFEPTEGGQTWGSVTLPGGAFAMEVSWPGVTVHLAETAVPGLLEGVTGTLEGGPDQPTAMDITWTPPTDGAEVFTRIPINHHAAGPTATECAVPASSGALHVDGSMLTPLSVITGLEFQGIEHVRFAAADTPDGCVELRLTVQSYPNLTY